MEYTIKRSRRKTIAVQVKSGTEIIVRAPLRYPQREIERFVAQHADWIESHLAKQRKLQEQYPEPDAAELERLRELARDYIPGRVERYATLMGLVPASVRITNAKTRFGSCSAKNGLCFSCRLMQYPLEAVDYVVVHELAHIVHKNHGKDFYRLIAQYMPDYAARRQLLKRN